MENTDVLVNEKRVSEITGLALSTLRNRRSLRKPPRYIKIGKSVRYALADVQAFIDANRIDPQEK